MDTTLDAALPAPRPPIIRKPAKKPAWRGLLVGMLSGGLGAVLAVLAIRMLGEDATGMGDKAALRATFGAWTSLVVALAALAAGWFAILRMKPDMSPAGSWRASAFTSSSRARCASSGTRRRSASAPS